MLKKRKENKKIGDYDNEYLCATRVKCKCGHSLNFLGKGDWKVCSWCGALVFKNRKAEFDYKFKRKYTKIE